MGKCAVVSSPWFTYQVFLEIHYLTKLSWSIGWVKLSLYSCFYLFWNHISSVFVAFINFLLFYVVKTLINFNILNLPFDKQLWQSIKNKIDDWRRLCSLCPFSIYVPFRPCSYTSPSFKCCLLPVLASLAPNRLQNPTLARSKRITCKGI